MCEQAPDQEWLRERARRWAPINAAELHLATLEAQLQAVLAEVHKFEIGQKLPPALEEEYDGLIRAVDQAQRDLTQANIAFVRWRESRPENF